MGKVHKSLRVSEELAAAVASLRTEGEAEAATYGRVISAGVAALTAQDGQDHGQAGDSQGAALVESLRGHIETLKAANAELSAQLAIKDKQIDTLAVLTAQAQQATTRALDAPQPSQQAQPPQQPQQQAAQDGQDGKARRGFWARFTNK